MIFGPFVGQAAAQTSAYEVYYVKTMTDSKILPTTYPVPALSDQALNITACPGEYEPASFVLHALQAITGLQATATDLVSGQNTIPASALDIKVVKCWYQAGNGPPDDSSTFGTFLTPELLLNDDNLVKVDTGVKKNYLRQPDSSYICISDTTTNLSGIQPKDAATLQPVSIDASTNKQFWVTAHVPDNATAGTYQGTIRLTGSNVPDSQVPVTLTVLPFTLEKSPLTYSIYYAGYISGSGSVGYAQKSVTQYTNEMKDLHAHGVDYPQFAPRSNSNVQTELNIRKQVGLAMTGPVFNQDMVNPSASAVQSRIALEQPYGFTEFFFYGLDEASGSQLTGQRSAWTAIRNAGGKIYVATADVAYRYFGYGSAYDTFGLMGDILDLAVEGGPPMPDVANDYHKIGHKVFNYLNPQTGAEMPYTFRLNYGLSLWKAGYDGAMDCAYMNPSGNSLWNDFDGTAAGFRDEVMAYPTTDGVIDTIEWEGFREGVDDTRYAATLQKAIKNNPGSTATAAQNWLNNFSAPYNGWGKTSSVDLDGARKTMIDYILQLQGADPPDPNPTPAPVASFSASATSGAAPLTVNFVDSSTNSPTSWSWSFGDGGSSTSKSPSHTFTSAGTYTVTLTASNASGSSSSSKTITVTSPAPVASFSASPTSGPAPLAVSFTDTSTNSPTSWSWSFGDGGSSTSKNPSHTFNNGGTYTVTLTATNAGGSNSASKTITVTAPGPVAGFNASPTSGTAPLAVNFTDTSTNSPTSWSWSFGDGGSSTSKNPSHTFTNAGTYTVTLTASNSSGSNSTSKTITVTSPAPVAGFNASPTSGTAPLAVNFTDTSTNSPTSWSWSFGDGGASNVKNPSHTFNSAGTFTVTLTATNASGSNSTSRTITVSAAAQGPVAGFNATPTSGQAPLAVNFTDTSSGSPTSWSWDFGDGTTTSSSSTLSSIYGFFRGSSGGTTSSATPNPSHTYSSTGTFTATLTVSNANGSSSTSKVITVTAVPVAAPVANFSASPTSGQAPLAVNFTDASTGSPTSWSWNFGDGTTSSSRSPNHTFSSAGTFTVTLTVANAGGSSSKSLAVTATTPNNPSYYISPSSKSFSYRGGSSSIKVIPSQSSEAWSASSNVSWITVTRVTKAASGSGKVYYSVARNLSGPYRTGTISVAGNSFTVTESGKTSSSMASLFR
jgi:PKD repeat protein